MQGEEQYCQTSAVYTYNNKYKYPHCSEYTSEGGNITYGEYRHSLIEHHLYRCGVHPLTRQIQCMRIGGYSKHIVVNKDFALIIPKNIDLAAATPLLCAGDK